MTRLLQFVARVLFLPTLVVSVAMLVKAYSDVGDGFSAGVTAALGVLMQYLVFGFRGARKRLAILPLAPAVAVAGLLLMLGVAFFGPLLGEPPFSHYPGPVQEARYIGSLELHTAMLFDLGNLLAVLGMAISTIELLATAYHRERQ